MLYRLLPLAAAMLALASPPAYAACTYKPFVFHAEQNDAVVVEAIVNAGTSCVHQFGEGPATNSPASPSSASRSTAS